MMKLTPVVRKLSMPLCMMLTQKRLGTESYEEFAAMMKAFTNWRKESSSRQYLREIFNSPSSKLTREISTVTQAFIPVINQANFGPCIILQDLTRLPLGASVDALSILLAAIEYQAANLDTSSNQVC